MKYEVVVGNIGTVYKGNNRAKANRMYEEYVMLSNKGTGRASGEPVTFTSKGDIAREYIGARAWA